MSDHTRTQIYIDTEILIQIQIVAHIGILFLFATFFCKLQMKLVYYKSVACVFGCCVLTIFIY